MHFLIRTHHNPSGKISAELYERDHQLAEDFRKGCQKIGINHMEQTVVILQSTHRLVIFELDHQEAEDSRVDGWLEYETDEPNVQHSLHERQPDVQAGGRYIILCVANRYRPRIVVRYRMNFGAPEAILMAFAKILTGIKELDFPKAPEEQPPVLEPAE
jgi:hypothetical protein